MTTPSGRAVPEGAGEAYTRGSSPTLCNGVGLSGARVPAGHRFHVFSVIGTTANFFAATTPLSLPYCYCIVSKVALDRHLDSCLTCNRHPQICDIAGSELALTARAGGKAAREPRDRPASALRSPLAFGSNTYGGYAGGMTTPESTHDHVEYWYAQNKPALLGRLRRIEGQVRGVHRMVDEDTYCIDVLTQVSAATKALRAVAMGLLDEHVRHCVRNAAVDGEDPEHVEAMVTEATDAIDRLLRS